MTVQHIKSPIVGAKYLRGAPVALAHQPEGSDVLLVRQPRNAYDRNAVAVFSDATLRQQLGYVLRDVARALAGVMDARGLDTLPATYHWRSGKPEITILIEH